MRSVIEWERSVITMTLRCYGSQFLNLDNRTITLFAETGLSHVPAVQTKCWSVDMIQDIRVCAWSWTRWGQGRHSWLVPVRLKHWWPQEKKTPADLRRPAGPSPYPLVKSIFPLQLSHVPGALITSRLAARHRSTVRIPLREAFCWAVVHSCKSWRTYLHIE